MFDSHGEGSAFKEWVDAAEDLLFEVSKSYFVA